jgi:hypothetical protein
VLGAPKAMNARRRKTVVRGSVIASLAGLALAASALALTPVLGEVTVAGTLETPTHLTLKTTYILYYLQLRSGSAEQRFAVQLTPPAFATAGGLPEGQSIDGPTDIALQGPGTIGDMVQQPSAITPCSSRTARYHGYATGVASVDVLLPPDSNTTLAVRYDTGRRAPWSDSDFRLTFTIEPYLVGTYPAGSAFAGGATVTTASSVTTAGPVVSGRTGAHILLKTSPAEPQGEPYGPRTVSGGSAIEVSGRLLPAAAGRRIVLQWDRGGGALHTLATVHTSAGGRFGPTRWRPGGAGTYELWASYPAQSGGLVADATSCPLRFSVG